MYALCDYFLAWAGSRGAALLTRPRVRAYQARNRPRHGSRMRTGVPVRSHHHGRRGARADGLRPPGLQARTHHPPGAGKPQGRERRSGRGRGRAAATGRGAGGLAADQSSQRGEYPGLRRRTVARGRSIGASCAARDRRWWPARNRLLCLGGSLLGSFRLFLFVFVMCAHVSEPTPVPGVSASAQTAPRGTFDHILPTDEKSALSGAPEAAETAWLCDGRYWARTSDPQLVDSGQRSRQFAGVRSNSMVERKPSRERTLDRTRANADPCHSCHAGIR
jgi:hypothetical protein